MPPRHLLHASIILLAGVVSFNPAASLAATFEDIQVLNQPIDPMWNLATRGDGHFYGISRWAQKSTGGFLYRFAPDQNVEILFTFAAPDEDTSTSPSGSNPLSSLVAGQDGSFYGTTSHGGAHGAGTIFRWSPDGVLSVLHDIDATTDGSEASKLLVLPDGDLLGIMGDNGPKGSGTIFRLSQDGNFQTIHSFERTPSFPPEAPVPSDARFEPFYPNNLVFGQDGKIYGTTSSGGPVQAFGRYRYSYGTFFRLEDSGNITVLGDFHPYKKSPSALIPVTDGFFVTIDGAILHVGFDGTIGMELDFATMHVGNVGTIWAPLATSLGIYGVSTSGGQNNGGFISRTLPEGGTSIIHHLPTNFRLCRPTLGQGTDGLVYGFAQLTEIKGALPKPRVFRLLEGDTANFAPVAAPDVAWLPAKTTNGKREVVIDVLANDQDPDSDRLSLTAVSAAPGEGTAEIVPTSKGARVKFTTAEQYPAGRVITYQLSDGQGGLSTGYISIESPVTGSFSGLASGGEVDAAPLSVKFAKGNSLTVAFDLNGVKYKGKGRLNVDDTANITLVAKEQPLLNLRLELQRGPSASLDATIRNGEADYHATCTAVGGK
ncbi:choice-of-anchor tandem repeat GloVer-containing protein [Luteolibacter soli]|uniref:Choice-of-anchor tandem repeat GloVer-containing protein n=1 Tax=Luteolibacter soli TaxID=3135280 RepID=A0ABU9ATF1_9BACT